jgi:hypothetical protein
MAARGQHRGAPRGEVSLLQVGGRVDQVAQHRGDVFLAPTNPLKVLLDIGAPLVITWLTLTKNYVSDTEPIQLAWQMRSRWALPVIAVATTCLTVALATEAANSFPVISFGTTLSTLTTGLLILPTALIFFITPESRPNKAGSRPGPERQRFQPRQRALPG